jgi:hypothetical protein
MQDHLLEGVLCRIDLVRPWRDIAVSRDEHDRARRIVPPVHCQFSSIRFRNDHRRAPSVQILTLGQWIVA